MGIFIKQIAFTILSGLVEEINAIESDDDTTEYFTKRKEIIDKYKSLSSWKKNVLKLCEKTGMSQDDMIHYVEKEISPSQYFNNKESLELNENDTLVFEKDYAKRFIAYKKDPVNIYQFGGYEWQILDAKIDKTLLITKDVINIHMPYNQELIKVDWKTCSLRKWLNNDFYNTFNEKEQSRILTTDNVNEGNPWYGIKETSNTSDKIFLLSLFEVAKYFGDSGDLLNKKRYESGGEGYYLEENGPYLHDKYNRERIANYSDSPAWWWLRSPGYSGRSASIVSDNGNIIVGGGLVNYDFGRVGARPALWLTL